MSYSNCIFCGKDIKFIHNWCGSQKCLMNIYKKNIEKYNRFYTSDIEKKKIIAQQKQIYNRMDKLARGIINAMYDKAKRRKLEMMKDKLIFGKQLYRRRDWIGDLSRGDRQYLERKGITEDKWKNMDAISQNEWIDECKNMLYYKNDKQLKSIIKKTN